MCTLTWFRHEAGYELFFNRDERHERAAATGLRRGSSGGVGYLAPLDGEAGGTWLGVNEWGVTIALLNRYPDGGDVADDPNVLWHSRGQVVLEQLGSRSIDSVVEGLQQSELARTRPFTLVALQQEHEPLRCAWDGDELSVDQLGDSDLPITSVPVAVARTARSAAFDALRAGGVVPGVLERYHASHVPAAGPLSVCLHGERSSSRSFAHIRVAQDRAVYRYRDRQPCEGGPDEVLELPLSARD